MAEEVGIICVACSGLPFSIGWEVMSEEAKRLLKLALAEKGIDVSKIGDIVVPIGDLDFKCYEYECTLKGTFKIVGRNGEEIASGRFSVELGFEDKTVTVNNTEVYMRRDVYERLKRLAESVQGGKLYKPKSLKQLLEMSM